MGEIRNEEIRAMVITSAVMNHITQQWIKWFGRLMRRLSNQPFL